MTDGNITLRSFSIKRGTEQKNIADPLEIYRTDLGKDYPPKEYLLTRNGIGCFPRGDIQGMAGGMKQGKTTAALCIMAALLKGEYMGFKATKPDYKVLVVDTEQSTADVIAKQKMLLSLVGWEEKNNPRLQFYALRNAAKSERADILEKAVNDMQPDFVFLDGIVDICGDFMDSKDSQQVIQLVMRLSNDRAIMCAIHTNKKDKDLMRGHLGTELANKCSECYFVTRSDKIVTVSQDISRGEQLEKWAFSFGENGKPTEENADQYDRAEQSKKEELRELFTPIFSQKESYPHGQLYKKCVELGGIAKPTAERRIKAAVMYGIIKKDAKTRLYYQSDFFGVDLPPYTGDADL